MTDHYNFDAIIDRSQTNALAKDGYVGYLFPPDAPAIQLSHPEEDLISLWVADMAFASAPAAHDAIQARLRHPILGYTALFGDDYYNAFSGWTRKQYDWSFDQAALQLSLGVIPALFDLVDVICAPDEKIVTLTPAYGYFKHAVDYNQRVLLKSPLVQRDGVFTVDLDDLRAKVSDPAVKLFFLCHPHNPTGRLWTETELRGMAEICFENDVIIVSDEIHCDLVRTGKQHIPLASLYPDSLQIVTCMAPSKTFNLAGLMIANIIISCPEMRAKWKDRTEPFVNPISLAAAQGVYTNGAQWLDALKHYLDQNLTALKVALAEQLPKSKFDIPDATYLAWIDLSAYFPINTNLTRLFLEQAGVIVEGGEMFVADGDGWIRINVACPRSVLLAGVERIAAVVLQQQALSG